MESFIFIWTNYVYGKDDANNIQKKNLTMIIQNRVEDKIWEARERVEEKAQSINYLPLKDLVKTFNYFINNESWYWTTILPLVIRRWRRIVGNHLSNLAFAYLGNDLQEGGLGKKSFRT